MLISRLAAMVIAVPIMGKGDNAIVARPRYTMAATAGVVMALAMRKYTGMRPK